MYVRVIVFIYFALLQPGLRNTWISGQMVYGLWKPPFGLWYVKVKNAAFIGKEIDLSKGVWNRAVVNESCNDTLWTNSLLHTTSPLHTYVGHFFSWRRNVNIIVVYGANYLNFITINIREELYWAKSQPTPFQLRDATSRAEHPWNELVPGSHLTWYPRRPPGCSEQQTRTGPDKDRSPRRSHLGRRVALGEEGVATLLHTKLRLVLFDGSEGP